MRRTHLSIIIIYLFIILYFAVFNWDMFTADLNISLGLGIIRMPLLIVLFVTGIILLLVEWAVFKIFSLKIEHDLARKDTEINKLKAVQYDVHADEAQRSFLSLKELHHKIDLIMDKHGIDVPENTKAHHPNESTLSTSVVKEAEAD